MLNISGLKEGFVLDHIQAGRSMDIYFKLGLDKLDCQVAIIKNARSSKMGRKDIIKIDGSLDLVNVDVLHRSPYHDQHHQGWKNRREKRCQDAEKNHKCHPLQKPALHYLDRAGASAYLLSRG